MKMVKSLLLGTAAGLVAMTGAQAADLPVKAKPVQYVKICSLYGAGFFYIPGTDTCLKVGGFLRAEADFNANGSFNPYRSVNFDDPGRNREVSRVRGGITVDARSQTSYGTLRAYIMIAGMNTNSGSPGADGRVSPGGNAYNVPYTPAMFLQFAGFTAGSTESFFTFDAQPYSNETPWWSSSSGGNGNPTFAYTAQFGNGFSATLSAEDTTGRQSSILDASYVAPALYASAGNNGYAGRRWPDLVANLRIDQAWGSAQIMGAVHDVYANLGAGVTDAKTGYAIGGGVKLNVPSIGAGDYFLAQVAYMAGATNYIAVNSGFGGTGAVNIKTGFPGVTNSAIGPILDATQTSATSVDLTKGWDVTAGYEHIWNPMWKTSLYGGYGQLRYTTAASGVIAGFIGGATAGSANWSSWNIGSRTVWTPVQNLDLSVDVIYTSIKTGFGGSVGPAAQGTYSNKNFVAGIFRAQRNFWP